MLGEEEKLRMEAERPMLCTLQKGVARRAGRTSILPVMSFVYCRVFAKRFYVPVDLVGREVLTNVLPKWKELSSAEQYWSAS